MKITLAPHGGLAAGLRLSRPPRQLDADALPPDTAAELARLVTAAKAAGVAADNPRPVPDAMSYTITIEDGGRQTVLKQSDTAMSPAFAALLTWIQSHLAKE
jgi:emfourin